MELQASDETSEGKTRLEVPFSPSKKEETPDKECEELAAAEVWLSEPWPQEEALEKTSAVLAASEKILDNLMHSISLDETSLETDSPKDSLNILPDLITATGGQLGEKDGTPEFEREERKIMDEDRARGQEVSQNYAHFSHQTCVQIEDTRSPEELDVERRALEEERDKLKESNSQMK